ncbi:MAG: acetoin utilization protein AcuC [Thermoplasmata archaeon]|nr:acetoin utilization protein AcuC [Thermoplasmata archaeon]
MNETRCPLTVVWDDRFLEYDFGPQHPFSERSRRSAVRLLEEIGQLGPDASHPLQSSTSKLSPAPRDAILRFHSREYVERVERASSPPFGLLDGGDTPSFSGCAEASARLVQGTLDALRSSEGQPHRHGFQPGGGLHHAAPDHASGFCIYNDVAIAISAWLRTSGSGRVAYVDIDAHHGDGVMYGFYEDGRVLHIDVHQDGRTLFPGTGAIEETGRGDGVGLKVNVPLPPGAGDLSLLGALERLVPPLFQEFRPELVVVQMGADGLAGDPLARLRYSSPGHAAAVSLVHHWAHETGPARILATGGGGYGAAAVAQTLARDAGALAGIPIPTSEHEPTPPNWRREFTETFGSPAPDTWMGSVPSIDADRESARVGTTMAALERALGRKFPVVSR